MLDPATSQVISAVADAVTACVAITSLVVILFPAKRFLQRETDKYREQSAINFRATQAVALMGAAADLVNHMQTLGNPAHFGPSPNTGNLGEDFRLANAPLLLSMQDSSNRFARLHSEADLIFGSDVLAALDVLWTLRSHLIVNLELHAESLGPQPVGETAERVTSQIFSARAGKEREEARVKLRDLLRPYVVVPQIESAHRQLGLWHRFLQ